VFAMHAPSRLAIAPGDPDRVFAKRTWALTIGDSGFDQMVDIDDVFERRRVMCTNLFHQVVVDPADSSAVYAATAAGVWKEPEARGPRDRADLVAMSRAGGPLGGAGNGLRRGDGAADEYIWSIAFDPADAGGNTILAGSRGGAIYETSDRGITWNAAP